MSHIPFAFWLADILRPRIFVELGSYTGVSFCAFCQSFSELRLGCQAYAIDTWKGDANMGAYPEAVHEDLFSYVASKYAGFASLIRASFAEALNQFEDGSLDLLHIDGCHSEEAMLRDFEMWLPKLSPRGVILMHDIAARLPGYGGVSAWNKIAARYPAFAFTHGYGLGIVLPGDKAPEELKALTRLDADEAARFANRFQQQARIYERLFNMEQERKAEKREAERKNAELQRDNDELHRLLETEREKLREETVRGALSINALKSSLSWKLTAPLRKVAAMFRE